MLGITLATCAGLCASLASVCAKFAMSENTIIVCKTVVTFLLGLQQDTMTVTGSEQNHAGDVDTREGACESVSRRME